MPFLLNAKRIVFIFTITDYLGNVRLNYSKNLNGGAEVLEENNYYPFGLKHEGYNALGGNPSYNYEYNGKELQQETGWNDYGARMYMSDLGRWGVIDPLAEQMRRYSPYNYAFNNPVSFVDPDGRKPMIYNAGGIMRWEFDPLTTINGVPWFEGPALSYSGLGGSEFLAQGESGGGDGSKQNKDPKKDDKKSKSGFWKSIGNFFKGLFGGGKKSLGRLEVGPAESITANDYDGVRLSDLNDKVGDKVLPAKETILGKIWSAMSPREWEDSDGLSYQVNSDGVVTNITPLMGDVPLGPVNSFKITQLNSFYVRAETLFSKGTYEKTVQALASLKEGTSLIRLIKSFEAEAHAIGAKEIIIKGIDIVETRLIKDVGFVKRMGYTVETTKNSIKIHKTL